MRLTHLLLARDGRVVTPLLRPIGGRLAGLVGASLSRQWSRVATGLALVVLAVAFAGLDRDLQRDLPGAGTRRRRTHERGRRDRDRHSGRGSAGQIDAIAQLPGVQAVEPMQHRFAYVGTDLQDLYGVDPATLTRATRLVDAYFLGGSAKT